MSTFGWPSPNFGPSWIFYGFNTENNVSAPVVTMPESGTITSITFHCGQLSGSGSIPMKANGCLWGPSGNLLASGAQVTLPVVGTGSGAGGWVTSGGMSFAMAVGTQFGMGWWRDPQSAAGSNIWGFASNGTTNLGTTAGSAGPGAFGGDGSTPGQIGVYITYTPTGGLPPPPPLPASSVYGRTSATYELMREHLIPR